MANCVVPHANLRHIQGTLQAPLNEFEGRDNSIILIAMAPAEYYAIPPLLLHCVCPPQVAEPCSRTVTGSRCWLLSCINLGNGFHYSHSSLCNLDQAQTSSVHSLRRYSTNPSAANLALNPAMARIRHRMRSRRGGTRGGIIRPPASPSSDSDSPDSSANNPNPHSSFYGRYLDTRSGRGRARLQGTGRRDVAVHTADFPLPPHPAPHTTQFHFRSTLTRPVITATVTISFSEEIDPQAPLPEHKDEQNRAAPSNRGIRIPSNQQHDDDKVTLHGEVVAGSQPTVESKHGTRKHRKADEATRLKCMQAQVALRRSIQLKAVACQTKTMIGTNMRVGSKKNQPQTISTWQRVAAFFARWMLLTMTGLFRLSVLWL